VPARVAASFPFKRVETSIAIPHDSSSINELNKSVVERHRDRSDSEGPEESMTPAAETDASTVIAAIKTIEAKPIAQTGALAPHRELMSLAIPELEILSRPEQLRTSLKGWMPRVGKGSLAILDQGVFASSNFMLNVLLARWFAACLPSRCQCAFAAPVGPV
jgi:hypothetical protein